MNRFTDRVALVTGGARGIGRATAARLHAEGASVAVVDVDADAVTATAAEIGDRALGLAGDVTDDGSIRAAVAATAERFGGLDVLVTNVGVAGGTEFEAIDDAAWTHAVEPTLRGAVRSIQAALAHLTASDHAAVVMIGSVNGLAAFGDVPYSAAKAGLSSLAQNLTVVYGARELARRQPAARPVRFNVVAPGTVHTRVWDDQPESLAAVTELYPTGRVGQPEDIAAAVAFLASDDAAWISGITLPVDGGMLTGPLTAFLNQPNRSDD